MTFFTGNAPAITRTRTHEPICSFVATTRAFVGVVGNVLAGGSGLTGGGASVVGAFRSQPHMKMRRPAMIVVNLIGKEKRQNFVQRKQANSYLPIRNH